MKLLEGMLKNFIEHFNNPTVINQLVSQTNLVCELDAIAEKFVKHKRIYSLALELQETYLK